MFNHSRFFTTYILRSNHSSTCQTFLPWRHAVLAIYTDAKKTTLHTITRANFSLQSSFAINGFSPPAKI